MATVLRTNFTNGEVAPSLEGQVDLKKLFNSCLLMDNFCATVHGPAEYRQGFDFVAETKDHSAASLLVPFQFNNEQTYNLEFGDAGGEGYLRVFHHGAQVLASSNGNVYEIESPYASGHFSLLRWLQLKDVLVLVHPEVAPHKLSRTDHDAWTFEEIDFSPQTATPASITPVVTNDDGSVTIPCYYAAAAITEKDGEGLVVKSSVVNRPIVMEADTTANVRRHVTVTIARVEGAKSYVVYRNDNIAYGYVGYVEQPDSGDPVYTDRGAKDPDLEDTPLPENNPFSGAGDYPGVVSVFQNRLALANTTNDPGLVWLSRGGGQYFDFRYHTLGTQADDDAIEIHIASSRRDGVVGLVPRRQLFALTEGGPFVIGGGLNMSDTITPGNARAVPEGSDGSAPIAPIMVGNAALFVHSAPVSIMEMAYRYDSDSFPTNDMTMFAPHLGRESSFTQLALAQTPSSLVYAARENGGLVAMIYERSQDAVGLYRITTQGEVESISVIYDSVERRDQLWACIKRSVGGQTKRFIEVLRARFDGDTAADGSFLDCALGYDGRNTDTSKLLTASGASFAFGATVTLTASGHSPFTASSVGLVYSLQDPALDGYDVESARYRMRVASVLSSNACSCTLLDAVDTVAQDVATANWALMAETVSGLDHLEGESATVCADGCPLAARAVAGGDVSLRFPAAVVRVGLPYTGKLRPTRLEGGNPTGGTQQTKNQRILEVGVRFYKSIGGRIWAGEDEDNYERIPNDPAGRLQGSPPKLFTGDVNVSLGSGWSRDNYVTIEQDQPLPCTVLLLAVKETVVE